MKVETRATVSIAAALLYWAAQNAAHAQAAPFLPNNSAAVAVTVAPAQSPTAPSTATADAISAQAAVAARRDADPKLNGSVGDLPAKHSSK